MPVSFTNAMMINFSILDFGRRMRGLKRSLTYSQTLPKEIPSSCFKHITGYLD
jgi:hypothetical protein